MARTVWDELEEARRGVAGARAAPPLFSPRVLFGKDRYRGGRKVDPATIKRQELPSEKKARKGAVTAAELAAARGRGEDRRALGGVMRMAGLDPGMVGSILANTECATPENRPALSYRSPGEAYDPLAGAITSLAYAQQEEKDLTAQRLRIWQAARAIVWLRSDVLEKLKRPGAPCATKGDVEKTAGKLMTYFELSAHTLASMGDGARSAIAGIVRAGLEAAIEEVMREAVIHPGAAKEKEVADEERVPGEGGDIQDEDGEEEQSYDLSTPELERVIVIADSEFQDLVSDLEHNMGEVFPNAGNEANPDPSDKDDPRFRTLLAMFTDTIESHFGVASNSVSKLFMDNDVRAIAAALAVLVVESLKTTVHAGDAIGPNNAVEIMDEYLDGWSFTDEGDSVEQVLVVEDGEFDKYYLPSDEIEESKGRRAMGAIARFEKLVEARRQAAGAGDPFAFRAHPFARAIGNLGEPPTGGGVRRANRPKGAGKDVPLEPLAIHNPFGAPIEVPSTMTRTPLPSELAGVQAQANLQQQQQQLQGFLGSMKGEVAKFLQTAGFQGKINTYLRSDQPVNAQPYAKNQDMKSAQLPGTNPNDAYRIASNWGFDAKQDPAAAANDRASYEKEFAIAARVAVYGNPAWLGDFKHNPKGREPLTVFQAEVMAMAIARTMTKEVLSPAPVKEGETAPDLATPEGVKAYIEDVKDAVLDDDGPLAKIAQAYKNAAAAAAAPAGGVAKAANAVQAEPIRGAPTQQMAAGTVLPPRNAHAATAPLLPGGQVPGLSPTDVRNQRMPLAPVSAPAETPGFAALAAAQEKQHAMGAEGAQPEDQADEGENADLKIGRGAGFNRAAADIYQALTSGTPIGPSTIDRVTGIIRTISGQIATDYGSTPPTVNGGDVVKLINGTMANMRARHDIPAENADPGELQRFAVAVANMLAGDLGDEFNSILRGILPPGTRVIIESTKGSTMSRLIKEACRGFRRLAEVRLPADEQPRADRMTKGHLDIEDLDLDPDVKEQLHGYAAIKSAIMDFQEQWAETAVPVPSVTARRLPSGNILPVGPEGLSGKQWEGVAKEIEKQVSGALKGLNGQTIRVDDTLIKLTSQFRTTVNAKEIVGGLRAELDKRIAATVDPTAGYTGAAATIARKAVGNALAVVNAQLRATLNDLEKAATKLSQWSEFTVTPINKMESIGGAIANAWRGLGSLIKGIWNKLAGVRAAVDDFVGYVGTIAGEAINLPDENMQNTGYGVTGWHGDNHRYPTPEEWTRAGQRAAAGVGESKGWRRRRGLRAAAAFTDVTQQLAQGVPLSHFLDAE